MTGLRGSRELNHGARSRRIGIGPSLTTSVLRRAWRLPAKRNRVRLTRAIPVPMRDGVTLLADHYAPVASGCQPTILMRSPYGRGLVYGTAGAQIFAERGYHVLVQSTRGTFGSGGTFRPYADEPADGQDTVDWLRRQDWFDGRLAMYGASYLGYVQWALGLDPPPELTAMVISVGLHDQGRSCYEQGPFELYNRVTWCDLMAHQETMGAARWAVRAVRSNRRLAPALNRLPVRGGMDVLGARGVSWFDEWLDHPDLDDPYWAPRRATAALDRVTVPTLLIGGWHDQFLLQTMDQFQALRARGVETGLTVGPWTHLSVDMRAVMPQCLAWLDRHVAGRGTAGRPAAVQVYVGGARRWDARPDWPPADTQPRTWYLGPEVLSDTAPDAGPGEPDGATAFRYDPADPTPSAGGRIMSYSGGAQDNQAVEARTDVLTFTTGPLPQPVEVQGAPVAELHVSSDNPHADLFARICDVDGRGRSVNVTDRIVRCSPDTSSGGPAGPGGPGQARVVRLTLDPTAYRFLAGHRIRLQVAGGAHPRFGRNLGTGENPGTGTATRPVTHTVQHHAAQPSSLTLPTVPAS